jgi:LuxR family transcriptional regulator, maltose regulon positive regulatory protein
VSIWPEPTVTLPEHRSRSGRVAERLVPTGRDPVHTREGPPFEIMEAKLRPVAARRGGVARTALLDRLASTDAPVTAIIAPAGYGKTTLLAQWAERHEAPVAWVSVDDADNDPAVLCAYLAAAVDRIEPVGGPVFAALASHRPPVTLVTRLLAALEACSQPIALALDHVESLTNPACIDLISAIAARLPSQARLVLCSRQSGQLPLSRLRVEGRLMEIGVGDLALDLTEASGLMEGVGLQLETEDVEELVAHTEGWPAGLYLAALALRAGPAQPESLLTLTGESRFLSDYLQAEILDRVSPEDAAFLIRTSMLEALNGSLCDAALDTHGSADRLRQMEARNLLVVALDGHRGWYRYHRLLRELLRAELDRQDPEAVRELHRRAAGWCEAHGAAEHALHYAQAAGDTDQVTRLLSGLFQPVWASGRADTVMRWLQWLADQDLLDLHPALAVHGSLMYALMGRPVEAEMWWTAAERSLVMTDLPDGSSMESLLAYLRAFLCREGIAAMRSDASISYRGLGPTSPYRASMLYAEGLAASLDGSLDEADSIFARALEAARVHGATPVAAMVLAARGVIAAERDDWGAATELGEQAIALLGDGTFDEYWTSALVFAWGARVASRAGQTELAHERLACAARLRPLLTYALPVVSVQVLVEMARTYTALADPAGARAVLRQARDILQQRPDLGTLGPQVEQLRAELDSAASARGGASSLTAAELRVLPLLATHLSLREIADRLYVSRNTVKSQTISVYRKLGVSSRSEAITRLHELGLLVA